MAFQQLVAEGYVGGRVGSGTFVAAELPEVASRPAAAASPPPAAAPRRPRLAAYARRVLQDGPLRLVPPARQPRFDFRCGMSEPDATMRSTWRRLLGRWAERAPRDYAAPEGEPALREAIAGHMGRNRGVTCGADEVVVVSGSQQGLDLTSRVLLDPGDRVLIEEPHYPGARHAFHAAGATVVPIPVDGDGLDVASIPAWASSARLVHLTPSHQFPTGAVMPLSRRLALLEWAARREVFLLEDDYDSEYRYGGRPVGAVKALDRHGRALYLGTFSKTLFPALRLGFLVLPPALVEAFRAAKWLADRHSPTLEQLALAEFLSAGHFDRHLRRMRRRHAARRTALLDALESRLADVAEVVGTGGGIHMLVRLRRRLSPRRLRELVERAAAADVGVHTDERCHLTSPRRPGLLLGFGRLEEDEIREGIRRLAVVLRRVL